MKNAEHEKFISAIYVDYYPQIAAFCTTLLDGDSSEGDLCAQEVFEQAINDADKLIVHPNIVGWLRKTAHNRVKRYLRDKSKRSRFEVHINELSENYVESLKYIENLDEGMEKDIDIEREKNNVISELDDEEKELYQLRFVDKLKFRDIGKKIGLSESAARMRTVRLELHIKEIVTRIFE